MKYAYRYLFQRGVSAETTPLKVCPVCGSNLVRPSRDGPALRVRCTAGNMLWEGFTNLDDDGNLLDPSGTIAVGATTTTHCGNCNEVLAKLPGVVEMQIIDDEKGGRGYRIPAMTAGINVPGGLASLFYTSLGEPHQPAAKPSELEELVRRAIDLQLHAWTVRDEIDTLLNYAVLSIKDDICSLAANVENDSSEVPAAKILELIERWKKVAAAQTAGD